MGKKALKQGPCYQYTLHAPSVKSVLMFINQCIGLRLKGPNSQTVELQTSNTLASGSHYQKRRNPKRTSPHQHVFTWWGGGSEGGLKGARGIHSKSLWYDYSLNSMSGFNLFMYHILILDFTDISCKIAKIFYGVRFAHSSNCVKWALSIATGVLSIFCLFMSELSRCPAGERHTVTRWWCCHCYPHYNGQNEEGYWCGYVM